MVVVALGEPGVPVICWATLGTAAGMAVRAVRMDAIIVPVSVLVVTCFFLLLKRVPVNLQISGYYSG